MPAAAPAAALAPRRAGLIRRLSGAPRLGAPIFLVALIVWLSPAALPAAPAKAAAKMAAPPRKSAPAAKKAVKTTDQAPPAPVEDSASRPVAQELRKLAGGKLKSFYGPRGFWPLWVHGGKIGSEAGIFLDYLKSADLDGLKPGRYHLDELRRRVAEAKGGEAEALAEADLALSQAFADYVRDVRRPPQVKITFLDPELRPTREGVDAVLRTAAVVPNFADYVKRMGWMSPLYVNLRAALARTGPEDEAEMRRIALNLDRARILPGPWVRHIVVDANSARLFYYQDGKQQGTMRVVAGTPETPTPMLAGMVRYAILNPYWNVPIDLVQKKVAPKVLAGASLKSLGYEALTDWSANAAPLDPATIDWHAVAAGGREVRIRQLPGGANAMGRVKFMFPNDQGIYLHDTPDKALLKKPARHFSNGCVRLENAAELGKWLFGKPLSPESKAPEQVSPLPRPVPVYLTYLTATPTDKGIAMLSDVYGRDGKP